MRAICSYVTVWVVCFVIWGCHEGNLPLARITSTEIPNTGIKTHCHSLGDLLDANGVDLRNMETSDLNQIMIGSVVLDDSEMLCIVGDGESGNLYIYLRRKGEDRWNYKVLEKTAGGPLTDISRSKNYIYLVFHLTPSANETVILSNELEFQYEFMGWPLAISDDETIVYHNMMVHFSPFHHAEISIYSPHTGQDRKIFPMEPYQEFRLEHIKRVKAFYDKHNIDLDPESFNANLMGDVAINDDTSALAFVIAYESQYTSYYPDREGEIEPDPEYATEYTEVAYIYRDIKDVEEITYKEVLLSDLKKRYGDIPISEYLQTDRLNEVFTE